MDPYRILVCRQCSVGVWPNAVTAHFRSEAHELTLLQTFRLVEDLDYHQLDLCRPGELQTPVSPAVSLSDLPFYLNGQALHSRSFKMCIRVPERESLSQALKRRAWLQSMRGLVRERSCEKGNDRRKASIERATTCRLFASRRGSQYFEIYIDTARPTVDTTHRASAKDAIISELASLEKTQQLTREYSSPPRVPRKSCRSCN